eukprot:gene19587-26270_t
MESLARPSKHSFVRQPKNYQDLYNIITQHLDHIWPPRKNFWFKHYHGVVCLGENRNNAVKNKLKAVIGKGGSKLKDLTQHLDIFWIYHVQHGSPMCGDGEFDSYFDIVGPTEAGVSNAIMVIKELLKNSGLMMSSTVSSNTSISIKVDNAGAMHRYSDSIIKSINEGIRSLGGKSAGSAVMHFDNMSINASALEA